MANNFNPKYLILAGVVILAFIFIKPESGLFSTVDIEDLYPCPNIGTPSPCEGATWIDTPKCYWNISQCAGFCNEDTDCVRAVPVPNDCSLFFKPSTITQVGFCEYSFCKYTEDEPVGDKVCTATDLFLQKYKWYLITGLILIIAGLFAFEKDFGGKKRGLF